MIRPPGSIAFDEHDIHERFVRAAGAGGQNLRKTATAVELRLDLQTAHLPADVKERLIALAGRQVTSEGVLVVLSRVHRSQTKNRAAARERLLTLLMRAAEPPDERLKPEVPAMAGKNRLAAKHHQSVVKRRRKVTTADGGGET